MKRWHGWGQRRCKLPNAHTINAVWGMHGKALHDIGGEGCLEKAALHATAARKPIHFQKRRKERRMSPNAAGSRGNVQGGRGKGEKWQ